MSNPVAAGVPLTLTMSRKRMVLFLILSAAFVAAGILLLPTSPVIGWAAIVFFGLGMIVFVIQLVRPSELTLDADGFTQHVSLSGKVYRREWMGCSPFAAYTGRAKMVVYSTTNANRASLGNQAH